MCSRSELGSEARVISGLANVRMFGMQSGIIVNAGDTVTVCRGCRHALSSFDVPTLWNALQVSSTAALRSHVCDHACRHTGVGRARLRAIVTCLTASRGASQTVVTLPSFAHVFPLSLLHCVGQAARTVIWAVVSAGRRRSHLYFDSSSASKYGLPVG